MKVMAVDYLPETFQKALQHFKQSLQPTLPYSLLLVMREPRWKLGCVSSELTQIPTVRGREKAIHISGIAKG